MGALFDETGTYLTARVDQAQLLRENIATENGTSRGVSNKWKWWRRGM